jgi:hypothetical protein
MKRTFAAVLAAVSIGGTLLTATPAFAAPRPVTLRIQPKTAPNGTAVAITAKCKDKTAYVTVKSPALNFEEKGKPGKKLKVQLNIGWTVAPGKYVIIAECRKWSGKLCGITKKWLKVTYAQPPTPPIPPTPPTPPTPPKPKPIHGFKPDVVVQTGFGGMARSVASHHPAG